MIGLPRRHAIGVASLRSFVCPNPSCPCALSPIP